MKRNLLKAAALILAMICILCCRVPAECLHPQRGREQRERSCR